MKNQELPAVLEQRAAEIANTMPGATLSEARNILRDGQRLLGLEKTIKILDEGDLNLLALTVCLYPVPVPEKLAARHRRSNSPSVTT